MIDRRLAVMAVLSLLVLTVPATANYQVFSLGRYNVSLDFGGKKLTLEPRSPTSDSGGITRSTFFWGDNSNDWAAIYLFETQRQMSMEERMRLFMKPICKAVWIDEGSVGGRPGIVARGDARVEHGFGQVCHAGMVSMAEVGSSYVFAVMGHFEDEALNRDLIRKTQVEYVGEPVDI